MGGATVRSGGRVAENAALALRAARAASGFRSLGIGAGDVVAVYLRNDFPFFEASVAAGLVGAYSTPVNWHNSPDEARYIFENSGAKAIVIHADLYRGIEKAIPKGVPVFAVETPGRDHVRLRNTGGSRGAAARRRGLEPLARKVRSHRGRSRRTARHDDLHIGHDRATPKACAARHRPPSRLVANLRIISQVMGFTPEYGNPSEMVTVVTGPMYHSAPNAYGLFGFRVGANIILQPRFDPEELLGMIEKHKVTHLHMVPTMFVRLLKLPDDVKKKYDLSSLALRGSRGGALPGAYQAGDDRMVGAGDLRILRRHRNRGGRLLQLGRISRASRHCRQSGGGRENPRAWRERRRADERRDRRDRRRVSRSPTSPITATTRKGGAPRRRASSRSAMSAISTPTVSSISATAPRTW